VTDQNPNVRAKLEVNGSPRATIFYPIPFKAFNPNQDKIRGTLLHGGDIVKLFNRQTNSCICYETDKMPTFRVTNSDTDMSKLDSAALWVIESSRIAWGGVCENACMDYYMP